MVNLGKKFEEIIKRDFNKLPGGKITRLYDPVGGFKGIKNVCDFIAYKRPNSFYFEAKETKENTFNLKSLKQYEKLLEYKNIPGLYAGVLIWFSSINEVVWVNINLVEYLKTQNYKSVNIKNPATYDFIVKTHLNKKYPVIDFKQFLMMIELTSQ